MAASAPAPAFPARLAALLGGALALTCAAPEGGGGAAAPEAASPAEGQAAAPTRASWLDGGEAEIEVFQAVAPEVSLRALAAVDDDTAWIGGTGGTVARTTDGGATWEDVSPEGLARLDVRDLHAFGRDHAVAMTAGPGTASRILVTRDGGATWRETHRETKEASFLDGIAFWSDGRGVAYGDPLPGEGFRVLITEDFGARWAAVPGPMPLETGEASFAASGTGIRPYKDLAETKVWIATGANDGAGRVFVGAPFEPDPQWRAWRTTIPAAKPASGVFSLALVSDGVITLAPAVAVGGDFTDRERGGAACASWSDDEGVTWNEAEVGPRGQRAGCAHVDSGEPTEAIRFIATGQTGTDITRDGGRTWEALSDEGFHCVMQAAAFGSSCVWFAGQAGRAGRLPAVE